jgi:hypothetical protein
MFNLRPAAGRGGYHIMHKLVRRVIVPLRRHLLLICGALFLLAVVVVWWIFSAPIAPWLRSDQSVDVVTLLQQHLLAAGMIGGRLLILLGLNLAKVEKTAR